jgi:hypothetical protein
MIASASTMNIAFFMTASPAELRDYETRAMCGATLRLHDRRCFAMRDVQRK